MSELSRNQEIDEAINKLRSILWGTDDENFGASVYFIENVLRKHYESDKIERKGSSDTTKERIVEATLPYTLRPKSKDREKVIAAALEFIVNEFSYTHLYVDGGHGLGVVNVKDIMKLINDLRSE